MVDKTENEITEKQFYQKLCDLALYGSNSEFFDTVKILEKLGTVEAVEVLLKILLHHPKGLPSGDFDSYRSAAVKPLIRSWKLAPEKILPLIPIFCKYNLTDDGFVSIEDVLVEKFDEIGKEALQKAFISGLNDFDYRVRLGTLYILYDYVIMEDDFQLLVDAYKIETQTEVQAVLAEKLLENLNEENAETFFELIKNYRIDLNNPILTEFFYPEPELIEKTTPIFLRKWKEEKDETIRGLIHELLEELINSDEADVQVFSKDEIKQLQEMDIIKE